MRDARPREHLRAVVHRVGEPRQHRRLLRADVAAGTAVAAEGAGLERDAGGVRPRLERHVDRDRGVGRLHGIRRRPQRLRLGHRAVLGQRLRLKHRQRPLVAEFERGVPRQRLWPGGIAQYPVVGLQRHVGVDQRGAAEPAADEDVQVVVQREVEESRPGPRAQPGGVDLQFTLRVEDRARKLACRDLAAALEDAHALAAAGQARSRDRAAVARADDHDIVGGTHPRERQGKTLHVGTSLHAGRNQANIRVARRWAAVRRPRTSGNLIPDCPDGQRNGTTRRRRCSWARSPTVIRVAQTRAVALREAGENGKHLSRA